MTGWTPDELTALADASSLRLTVGDRPGGRARHGLRPRELYVRAYRGPGSRWFQAAQETGRGRCTYSKGAVFPFRHQ
jgi:hypothetical protein